MNKIADKLEDKYIGQQTDEALEILAFVQFYRIKSAEAETTHDERGLSKHAVIKSVCEHPHDKIINVGNRFCCVKCGEQLPQTVL